MSEKNHARTKAAASFSVKSWDEKPYQEYGEERKLTQAHVEQVYQGDLTGESVVKYLMSYSPRGASFVGIEFVTGALGGREGSFVLQHTGVDDGNGTRSQFFIVPGSGTGGFESLRGEGSFLLSGHADSYPITLEYWFEG